MQASDFNCLLSAGSFVPCTHRRQAGPLVLRKNGCLLCRLLRVLRQACGSASIFAILFASHLIATSLSIICAPCRYGSNGPVPHDQL